MKELFLKKLQEINVTLTDEQYQKFEIYYEVLIEWNEKINLTAITEKHEVFLKHFYDSICVGKAVNLKDQTILDVGSGAGFPSIPLKIVYPNLQVTIVDSLNKRIKFLEVLSEKLEISFQATHSRIEDFGTRNTYDIVTARAVAPLNILCEFCLPFVKLNGYFLPLKSAKLQEELKLSENAMKTLGGIKEEIINYSYDDMERYIIKIIKKSQTPKKYPRPFQQIKKIPL
ncbi:16S rRNA (guanine(527)-N(7))-methyltransferase RsmG [Liberiplasma polymorphum]|uniref:16S rRNA (guanine(527)-N(7))-methyltransferase RsmG n=1 Tax=Liberiplasma polymorphum TaxID=3374570 RepID=UPI003773B31E